MSRSVNEPSSTAPRTDPTPEATAISEPISSESRRWVRGFWSLIVTQFQGAFSDNVLKNLVVFLIVGTGISLGEKHRIGELVGALFALPFILFSMAGGYLADRYSKRTITIAVKIFEIAIMLFATAGLALGSLSMQLASVFLLGTHSAFFGPSKYGLLPELLPEKRLSWGNGILELGTFTAIILGTVAAGVTAEYLRGRHFWTGILLIVLAGIGLVTSLGISKVPPADREKRFRLNFLAEVWRQLRAIRKDRPLALALVGNTYFNFLGALFLLNIFFFGSEVLKVSETQIGLLNVALAMGIGAGSVAAGYLSGGKIEYGLVPLGAMGLTVSGLALSVTGLAFSEALLRLGLLGFSGGFFIVPVCALLQHRPEKSNKGGLLATANWLSFVGVFLASGAHYVMTHFAELESRHIFLVGGLLTLVGTIYTLWLLPDALLRFVLWLLTRTIYRIRVEGRDHIPAKGGALFVCNHLSHVDALLLLASTDRRIRFMMYRGIYELPWIKPLARIMRVIPISAELRPRAMILALREASQAIRDGEVVCIFAEGQITRIGQMLPFRRGFERIMKDVEAPIIPVSLDGVWGSVFSFERARFFWKWPRRIPYSVTVSFGQPMPANSTPVAIRQVVQELNAEAWQNRRSQMRPLHRAFVRTARWHPFRFAMADDHTRRISFGAALTRTVLLARRLKPHWLGQEKVGILLPASVPSALVNCAAWMMGKVPVNLNDAESQTTLASAIETCGIKTLVTTKATLERTNVKVSGPIVLAEDLVRSARFGEWLVAFLMAKLLPVLSLEKALGATRRIELDDLATLILTKTNAGDSRAVMLSHYNVLSNIEQLGQIFALRGSDRLLGLFPFSHAVGFTGTLGLPIVLGVGVVYHQNPAETQSLGERIQEHSVTILAATPALLQTCLRACAPEQFGSVQFVLAGGEKLAESLAAAFEERFGVRPFEAYGCAECAPVVAVNTRDFRAAGFRQVGAKRGKIGHPLPGVSVRIVDPETMQPRPLGQSGLLLVRGPNVMRGYLGDLEATGEVLRDGWFATGDVATLDEDGFLEVFTKL